MVLKYKDIHAFDKYKTMKFICNMYKAVEVSVHRACRERATLPYLLGWGGTIYPGSRPAAVTILNPRMVTECLLTRSMLIKMYLPFHGMCLYMYIVFTVSQFHADANSLVSLSNCINVLFDTTILSESMNISNYPVWRVVSVLAVLL